MTSTVSHYLQPFILQSAKEEERKQFTDIIITCSVRWSPKLILSAKHGSQDSSCPGIKSKERGISGKKIKILLDSKTHNALGPHLINLEPLMSTASKAGMVHSQTHSRRVNMIWCWHRPITVRGSNFQFMDAIKLWQYDCYNVWCVFDNKQEVGSWGVLAPHLAMAMGSRRQTCSDFCYCKATATEAPTMNLRLLHGSLPQNSTVPYQTKGHYLFNKHWLPPIMC